LSYLTDNKISIAKLKAGDKKEFKKVYFEFFDVLYCLCLHYTNYQEISEDIVQDAFLKLWEIKAGLKKDTSIKNFLFTITKNSCLNYLKSQQIANKHLSLIKERQAYYSAKALENIGDEIFELEELKIKIDNSIEHLPDNIKAVFKMNRYESMKYSEIADYLNISKKTVEARISKALSILRKELRDYLPVDFS